MAKGPNLAAPKFGQADLTNCDREPIHIPGSIQPHGAMLVYDVENMVVTHASSNASAVLGAEHDMIVGQPLEGVVGLKAAHSVRNAVAKSVGPSAPGLVFGVKVEGADTRFDVAAHTFQGHTFLEFEAATDGLDSYGPLELTRALTRRLADEKTVPNLARQAARMVALMLGYDRVMVYQLLHNGAGKVIAEQKRADLNSFLGQHFPPSDIPVQARELYKRNWIRMISDVRYTPQPLMPPLKPGESPLDMSYAQLRSVSPVHCEYLQNMGVGASMSISILVEGELWGLIACHHYAPKVVALPQRVGAELFGQFFSLQVETLERRERFEIAQKARARLDRIVAELSPEEDLHQSLSPRIADLEKLLPCDGAAVWINGAWIKTGFVPPEQMVKPLVGFLNGAAGGELWHTNQIQKYLPEATPLVAPPSEENAEMPAGVLAVPISHTPRDYLFFFRSEESRFVDWGGEPEKTVGPLGDRLTPRKSFDLWREEVRGQSTPWTEGDLAIADAAQNYLRDVVLRHTEATAEERKRTEVRRKLVNEELNHRVKNILSLVKSITEQSRATAASVEDYSAAVVGRIQALAFAHDQISRNNGGGDLRHLLESEVAAYGGVGASGRTILDGPPLRLNARAYSSVALVAHELSTNAAKYGALASETGMVRAAWKLRPNGDCEFTWVERGGKPVAPPSRNGFGSTLITRVVPFDLGGEAEIDFPPEGVVARFIIPARHLIAVQAAADGAGVALDGSAKSDGRPEGSASLTGKRVLLVEDQVLIALDAENCLKAMGAAQVVIAPTSEHAIKQISAAKPDLAVLDVNLGDHTSAPVAEMLRSQGVPFVFATGYGDSVMIPDSLKSVPVVRKPYGDATLAAAIAGVLKGGS
jgi:light-regulated signal transduction histidine kinase (bacteriophytochrome)/CheY-like chemotaxis protein